VPPAVDLVRPAALQCTPLLADPPAALHLLDSVERLVERLGPLVERLHRELGLGVAELSMDLPSIAPVKAGLRGASLARARGLARRALACATADEVRALPLA